MKILIVDDELVAQSKLKVLLSKYGKCDIAYDGEQALEMFIESHDNGAPYSLITLDIDMPGMHGQEMLALLREFEQEEKISMTLDEVKVLMVSGMTDVETIITSFKRGCEWYLKKPFNQEALDQAMSKLGVVRD